MNMQKICCFQLMIPFKAAFNHNSASRDTTESIWVEVVGDNKVSGFGESCPRSYVTGETIETARKFLLSIKDRLIDEVNNIDDLKEWVLKENDSINKNPAAWCAVELAMLDLFSKSGNMSVETALGLPEVQGKYKYSAVLGDNDIGAYKAQLEKYLALQFTDYKIKISGDFTRDKEKLIFFKSPDARHCRVRLDANNLWDKPGEVIDYIRLLDSPIWAIEEPVRAGDFNSMEEIAAALEVKIILDESFLNSGHILPLEKNPEYWVINLRISKMGGLIRSKYIVDAARLAGVGLIIGSQVGETSALTRSALTIAQYANDDLIAQEGAFGTYLLTDDVVDQPLMFSKAGIFDTEKLKLNQRLGFGLTLKSMGRYLKPL